MKPSHQIFVNEVLRHGDKTLAYKTAFPRIKDSSVPAALSRLMNDPEVDEVLNGNLQRMRAELEAEMRAKMQEEIAGELELKVSLTRIIRGQHIIPKYVWTKEGKQVLDQHAGFAQVVRSIVELAKMEGYYNGKEKIADRRAEEKKRQDEALAEQKRIEKEEGFRQLTVWREAMQEKFNTIFKKMTFIELTDHYKALGDTDEKEQKYILPMAYSRDLENGIEKPWERPEKVQPTKKAPSPSPENITPSLTTTNNKNVNDVKLTNDSSLTQNKDISGLTKLNKNESANVVEKTSGAAKTEKDKYANIGRGPGYAPLGPAPQLGTPEAKRYGMQLRANNWLPVQEMWRTANEDVIMGRKDAEYEQKKMKHLAEVINNKDPQMREVAKGYGLELHPDWLHWARRKSDVRRA